MAWFRCIGSGGGSLKLRTATGDIANFETNLKSKLNSCKCEINPLQDLHGYTKPWSGGTGKNKVDFPSYAYASYNGLTIQTTDDGGIKFSGTPTLTWALLTSNIDCSIPSGTTITFGINHTLTCRIYIYITYSDNTTANFVVDAPNTSATMTLAKDVIKVRLDLASMSTSTNYNETIYPMLEYGNTQSAFEPYENICPISGFSGANINVADENMVVQKTTAISFGQTVYGGVLDVTNGKLRVTHKVLSIDNNSALYSSGNSAYLNITDAKIVNEYASAISDKYEYNTWSGATNDNNNYFTLYQNTAWSNARLAFNRNGLSLSDFITSLTGNPIQVVYELATPTEITLTPKQIEALVGINNVYHDCNGNIEVKYLVRE